MEESSASSLGQNNPCIDDSTWGRLIDKFSSMDFDNRSIKTELDETGEPVPPRPVAAALPDLPDLPQLQSYFD